MRKGLEVGFAALAAAAGVAGCCAYRGISQNALVHVRSVDVAEAGCAGTNGVAEGLSNGVRVVAGRVVVVAENVYVSVGGGSAASNTVTGELSVPLVK